ncbi:MAG: SDR family NAD(P)-dependent oxidoreductase [Betaproteobacteria bacterium]
MSKKRIVIIGASSAIAEHCARLWAREAADFLLVGRDLARVQRVADDLRVRSPQSAIQTVDIDFLSADAILVLAEQAAQSAIDIVLIAHGDLPQQASCEQDIHLAQAALQINGVSPALFAEAFARQLAQQGHGTIALIGSVAGDRGRKANYVYGAGKGMVERYAQGLQHRFASTGVNIVLIKPGPTATPMTAHLATAGLAKVEQVAHAIVKAIEAGKPVVYVPAKWQVIMLIVQHLPRWIFHKLNI